MRINRIFGAAICLGIFLPTMARANGPDVKKIIKEADDATKELKAVSYEAEFFVTGDMADQAPRIKGKVKLKKVKSGIIGNLTGSGISPMRAEGTIKRPGSDDERTFKIATDGKMAYAMDDEKKTMTKGELPDSRRLLGPGMPLLMAEYAHPTPFDDELNAKEQRYEGAKKIGDQECDVIYIVYGVAGAPHARWYFSKEDHLPRRVDRIIPSASSDSDDEDDDDDAKDKDKDKDKDKPQKKTPENARVTMVTKLEVDPEFTKGTFRLKAPEGYEEKEYDADENSRDEQPQLLGLGKPAPDFELKTPEGQTVSLKSLKGKVVVLDFWATWCGPCKVAMPGLQKLHEHFGDKPVKVYGVNCWERGGDPAKFMKDKNYTYGLLLKGDKMAEKYKVSGIPTFYVIDPQGKIAFAGMYNPNTTDEELSKAIEKALKQSDM